MIASSFCRLCLGPDHLLSLDEYSFFFSYYERYRRFYYQDIQGITIRETGTFRNLTAIWSVLLLLILAAALLFHTKASWSPASVILFAVLGIPCVALLISNLWRGPSCEVRIHSAVQCEILPSLNRLRRARRFLELLQPRITQAQGLLHPEKVSTLLADRSTPLLHSISRSSHPPALPDHLARARSAFFIALSIALLLHALSTGMLFFYPGILLCAASTLLGIGASTFWVAAMIQSSKYRVCSRLQKFGWISMGYLSLLYLISMLYYSYAGSKNPALAYDAIEWLRLMGDRPVSQSAFLRFYDSFIVTGSGLIGLTGLILQRPSKATGSPAD